MAPHLSERIQAVCCRVAALCVVAGLVLAGGMIARRGAAPVLADRPERDVARVEWPEIEMPGVAVPYSLKPWRGSSRPSPLRIPRREIEEPRTRAALPPVDLRERDRYQSPSIALSATPHTVAVRPPPPFQPPPMHFLALSAVPGGVLPPDASGLVKGSAKAPPVTRRSTEEDATSVSVEGAPPGISPSHVAVASLPKAAPAVSPEPPKVGLAPAILWPSPQPVSPQPVSPVQDSGLTPDHVAPHRTLVSSLARLESAASSKPAWKSPIFSVEGWSRPPAQSSTGSKAMSGQPTPAASPATTDFPAVSGKGTPAAAASPATIGKATPAQSATRPPSPVTPANAPPTKVIPLVVAAAPTAFDPAEPIRNWPAIDLPVLETLDLRPSPGAPAPPMPLRIDAPSALDWMPSVYEPFRVVEDLELEDLSDGSPFSRDIVVASVGTLGGSGSLGRNLRNQGRLSPGHSPGLIEVEGDFVQDANAQLVLELAGTAREDFDRILVENNVELNGLIQVILLDGFEPEVGDIFDVIEAAVIHDLGVTWVLPDPIHGVGLRTDIVDLPDHQALRISGVQWAPVTAIPAVPEAGTLWLAASSCALWGFRRWRTLG